MRHRTVIASSVLLLALAGSAFADLDPVQPPNERGFSPEKVFQVGDLDAVDLSSGAVTLTIPIGGTYPVGGGLSYSLKLTWSSNLWDYKERLGQIWDPYYGVWVPHTYTQAYPNYLSNAGFGWVLSLGRLLDGSDPDNPAEPRAGYVAPDGSLHAFAASLHEGEPSPSESYEEQPPHAYTYTYTRDNSYLRERTSTLNSDRTVEHPDGTVFTFSNYATGKWRVTSMADRFGNAVTVTYTSTTWTITDSTGRTHTIYFNANGNIGYIVLATFDGSTATYQFTYTSKSVNRDCSDDDPQTSPAIDVQVLSSVVLPDSTSYSIPTYYTTCSMTEPTGMFPKLVLPTLGTIEWTFQRWSHNITAPKVPCQLNPPFEDCMTRIVREWPGIASKTLYNRNGDSSGATWWYRSYTGWSPHYRGVKEERRTVVESPLGDETVTYFREVSEVLDNANLNEGLWIWEFGLPFTRRGGPDSGGRYLSMDIFQGGVADVAWAPGTTGDDWPEWEPSVPGGKKGSVWVRYEHDLFDPDFQNDIDSNYRDTNRHLASKRTIYHDDKNCPSPSTACEVISDSFDFDGVGHYRTTVVAGSSQLGALTRSKSDISSHMGTYRVKQADGYGNQFETASTDAYSQFTGAEAPGHTYSIDGWLTDRPWILGVASSAQQDQYDSTQSPSLTTAQQQYCYQKDTVRNYPTTGYVRATRALQGSGPANTDLLVANTPDAAGNTIEEQFFGGDTQTNPLPSNYCSFPIETLTGEGYRIDHTYQYGSRRTSRYVDGNGNPLSYYILDRDIDQNTGLPSASRDTAGASTSFTYDTFNRLLWEKPQTSNPVGGAWVEYTYSTLVTGAPPAATRVRVSQRPNNQPSGAPLSGQEYDYDGFGRLVREKQLLPSQSWPASGACTTQCNQRLTTYNAEGWKTSVSEWQSYNPATIYKTEYLNFDPFGRPGTIRPPDGSGHDVSLSYLGARQTSRTVQVYTDIGGAATERDALTTEEYDRHGRLWKVTEPSGSGGADVTSTYGYDVGGRLKTTSTTSGSTTQTRTFTFDNRGLLTAEQLPEKGSSGNGTVSYSSYDARGHAGQVVDGDSSRTLRYCYDRAERLDMVVWPPTTCSDSTPANKLKELSYATANAANNWKNGKLEIATRHNFPEGSTDYPVVETYTYGGTGGAISARSTTVDSRTITQSFTWNGLGKLASVTYPNDLGMTSDPARTVSFTYSNGFLTAVPSFATSISYHANSMINTVLHANGVGVAFGKDPRDMRRPASIATSGASADWSTGTYLYDGAGNIKAIGSQEFIYDKVNRLTSGTIATASCGTKTQTVQYNAFAFLTSTTTTDWGTQSFTPDANGTTNHISGSTYDAAGNMYAWGSYAYLWDLENRITKVSGSGMTARWYLYTADGERIEERIGSLASPTAAVIASRSLDGKVLRLFNKLTAWGWSRDYVYRDGQLLASVDSNGTKHLHLDHLGTPRRITNASKTVTATHDYYPFGLEACGTGDGERMKFTGHERDMQSTGSQTDDLDYMHARYYNPTIARFLSADPGRDVDPKVPQAWNMYGYGRNNPVRLLDLDGRAVFDSAKRLSQVGTDVVNSADRQPDSKGTYCNYAVRDILQAGSDHTLDNKTAAAMTTFLADSRNATPLSFEDAVRYAKEGATVIVAKTAGPGHGHVAIVAPEDMKQSGKSWGGQMVPVVFNVGDKNGVDSLNWYYQQTHDPQAYILNKDKKLIDEKLQGQANMRILDNASK